VAEAPTRGLPFREQVPGVKKILVAPALALALVAVPLLAGTAQADGPEQRVVELREQCRRARWTTVPCAYGDAEDDGQVSAAEFRAAPAQGGHGAWWIRQRALTLDAGDTVSALNDGGVFHSFTEVAQFGKGCIPDWNAAVGADVDNCDPGESIATGAAPGATVAARSLSVGVHRVRCLIHPWMRTVVTVRAR
jgi:hypothetical protein